MGPVGVTFFEVLMVRSYFLWVWEESIKRKEEEKWFNPGYFLL